MKRLSSFFVPIMLIGAGLFTLAGMTSCDPEEDETNQELVGDIIQKAMNLKDNTYSIQKKGGEAQVFNFPPEYSNWYVGASHMDESKQSIHVELMDEEEGEDKEPMTMGWLTGEIPMELANQLTTVNEDFCKNYSWAYVKFGTFRLGQSKTLNASMGKDGNVKLNGSQFWLKEKKTKGYSGNYQLLFVFEFENQKWDQETQTYLPGDEYTICCNATLSELVADLSYFRLNYGNNWVAPGKSTNLTAYWTAGATFDWSKVKLTSQFCNGHSGDWFSWDASTRELYAKASADNELVQLTFSYEGTDIEDDIFIYNGPGYTSFAVSPQNGSRTIIAENEPQSWSSNDYVYIAVNEWTPGDYSSFNYHSIEIDPASDYYDQLYYNDYGPYVQFSTSIPEGDFNMILRSKADHSVKCTVPVKMVKHKVQSFQITYPHSNGLYEPWTSGGENGICNYPMGMSLGVITEPEDAYWDWSLVELESGYDRNFSFTGNGGREDHPKLFVNSGTGETQYGTQVVFRLKYDNRKTSTIYVDHN